MEILSQRDPRWNNIKLGFSNKTIGDFGCVITSFAMILGTTPDVVNEKLKAVKGFQGALVIWDKIPGAFKEVASVIREYSYNNDLAKANLPCLVEVDGSRIGATKHWVTYIGNGKMNDPWYGTEKSTSYYKPTGMAIVKLYKGEPMPKISKALTHFKVKNDDELIKMVEKELQFLKNERRKTRILNGKLGVCENSKAQYVGQVNKLKPIIVELESLTDREIDADTDVPVALNNYYLKRKFADQELESIEKKQEAPMKALSEGVKEPLRLMASGAIAVGITYLYSNFPILGEIEPDQLVVVYTILGIFIKALDKALHKYGKDKEISVLVKGLLRF